MKITKRTLITLAAVGVLIPIVIGIVLMRLSERQPLTQREAACQVMAEYLAETAKPRKVMVMANAYAQMPDRPEAVYAYHNSSVKGLKKGFGDTASMVVVYPALKKEAVANENAIKVDPQSKTPLSFLVAENAFDVQTAAQPETDVVVSLIGLPANLSAVASWKASGKPQYGLLLPDWRMIGRTNEIAAAFASGKLVAAVVPKPGTSELEAPMTKDHKAMFEMFYILVTANNVGEVMRDHPGIFR